MSYSRPVEWLEAKFDGDWEETIAGRDEPVPKPRIVTGGRQERIRDRDLLELSAGTRRSRPISVGWSSQRTDERVTVDIRTDKGDERMWGVLLADGTSERYGGLVGEAQRVLDSYRKGTGTEYDLIDSYEVRDLGDQAGPGRDRVSIEVEFSKRAETMWTDPDTSSPP